METYAQTYNETHLKISNTAKKLTWEPQSGVSSTLQSVNANFGGVEGEATYTTKIADAQQAHRWPDMGTNIINNARKMDYSSELTWEGGMTSVGFLKPRRVTFGSMLPTGDTNSNGVAQGPATYNHASKQITLTSGYLNSGLPA